MEWTSEEKRSVAGLRRLAGYDLLVKFFDEKAAGVLKQLKTAQGRDTVYELALKYAVWTEALEALKDAPIACENVLKQEGDPIYG